jgi:predicted ArsR family transcriptional regulator
MAWWQRQLGKTTRNRLVALLRRRERSVEELAQALGLTDNAVRAHLAALERENVVEPAGVRRDGTVGKPATIYGIAADSSGVFSTAYSPALGAVLAELRERMTPRQLEALLRRAGKRLAASIPARSTFDERVRAGATFLTGMGADAELVQAGGGYEIRGHGCVLSAAVSQCPATCALLEQVLRDVSGGEVRESCDRSTDHPNCRFTISPAA